MPAGILFCYAMVEVKKLTYKGNSVRIELDDGENLIIPVDISSVYSMKAGSSLSDTQYRQLKDESERFLCREKALSFLAARGRSGFEVRQFLKKKGFSLYILNETVQHLYDSRYLDDYAYALNYIRIKKSAKTIGKNVLIRELNSRGVPRSIISRAIRESFAEIDDKEEIYLLARKKFDSLGARKNRIAKVGQFLQGRGFEFDVIRSVLERLKGEGEKSNDINGRGDDE